jgi:hypothetical protein
MKLNFAMIAALLASFAAAPAFADWDTSDASSIGSSVASSIAGMTSQPVVNTVFSDISAVASSGFDLNSLNSIVSDATAGDASGSQQSSEYTANTTDKTDTQAVSTLQDCRTATLAEVIGPVNENGLPACALGSLAATSSVQGNTAIYGTSGRYGAFDMTRDIK